MSTKQKYLAGALLVAVGTGAFALRSSRSRPSVTTPSVSAAPPTDALSVCGRSPGDAVSYQMVTHVVGTVGARALGLSGVADPLADRTVSATLETTSLPGPAGPLVLLARWTHVTGDPSAAALAAPFLFRVGNDCALSGFAREKGTALAYGRSQQSYLHTMDWVRTDGDRDRENGVGAYRAVYATVGDEVTWSVQAYKPVWGASERATPTVSRGSVKGAGTAWFASLEASETLVTAAANTRTTVTVERAPGDASAFTAADRDASHYVWQDLLPRMALQARAERSVTREDLAARAAAPTTAKAALVAHAAFTKTERNFDKSWRPLSAFLEAHPEQTGEVVRGLLKVEVGLDALANGWVAVGQARTDEAREALLGVMRDGSQATMDRARAMFAMVDRSDLGEPFAREVARQANALADAPNGAPANFARESALALGAFANLHGETDEAVHGVAEEAMTSLLSRVTGAGRLHTVFAAIGTLGDARLLPAVHPFTTSSDAKIRAGAALTIRKLHPEETSAWVVEWLSREKELTVRHSIYATLEKQAFDAHVALRPALLDSVIADLPVFTDATDRHALVSLLGANGGEYAPARAALVAQARIEFQKRTGLYTTIARHLTPEESAQALGGAQ